MNKTSTIKDGGLWPDLEQLSVFGRAVIGRGKKEKLPLAAAIGLF
jgi:hypothetical protein